MYILEKEVGTSLNLMRRSEIIVKFFFYIEWTLQCIPQQYFILTNILNPILGSRTYEIYYTDIKYAGFKDFHRRLQPWIMFFIDAASYIDDDDDNWRFFLL